DRSRSLRKGIAPPPPQRLRQRTSVVTRTSCFCAAKHYARQFDSAVSLFSPFMRKNTFASGPLSFRTRGLVSYGSALSHLELTNASGLPARALILMRTCERIGSVQA